MVSCWYRLLRWLFWQRSSPSLYSGLAVTIYIQMKYSMNANTIRLSADMTFEWIQQNRFQYTVGLKLTRCQYYKSCLHSFRFTNSNCKYKRTPIKQHCIYPGHKYGRINTIINSDFTLMSVNYNMCPYIIQIRIFIAHVVYV